jgi:hypothetical protein
MNTCPGKASPNQIFDAANANHGSRGCGVRAPDGTGLPDSPWFDNPPRGNHGSRTVDFLLPYIQNLRPSKWSVILTAPAGVTYYHHDDVGFHPDVHVYLLLYACVFWHGEADDLRIT